MLAITKKTSTAHTTASKKRKIEWIVVHYTAGTSSKPGKAAATAAMFATSNRDASADFIVDDGTIVQYNPDIPNRYCWSVGGSQYVAPKTSERAKYYGKCTNKNSISIEMNSNKKSTKTLNWYDTDWYLTEATMENCADLVKYLMKEYKIDINHVIMHHQVTGKPCPQPFCVNEAALVNWKKFKERLTDKPVPVSKAPVVAKPTLKSGSSGTQVKYLQQDLNYVMKTKLAVDGKFGSGTKSALVSFQKKYGLVADGIYGVKSEAKMKTLCK